MTPDSPSRPTPPHALPHPSEPNEHGPASSAPNHLAKPSNLAYQASPHAREHKARRTLRQVLDRIPNQLITQPIDQDQPKTSRQTRNVIKKPKMVAKSLPESKPFPGQGIHRPWSIEFSGACQDNKNRAYPIPQVDPECG